MAIVRRFTKYPTLDELANIESVVIVDLAGPAPLTTIGSRVCCIVGEFLKGPYIPTRPSSIGDLIDQFGSFSSVIPHAAIANRAQGNGFLALARKKFATNGLIIQRVDLRAASAASGVAGTGQLTSLTFGGTPTPSTQDFVLPAGFRFSDQAGALATKIVCLAEDVTVPKGSTMPYVVSGVDVFFNTGVDATAAGLDAIDTVFDTMATFGFPTTMTLAVVAPDLYIPGTVVVTSSVDAAYAAAILKTLPNEEPANTINVIWSAMQSTAIATNLDANEVDSSASGPGRMAVLRCASQVAKPANNAAAEAAFGAGNRDARNIWVYPHVRVNPQLTDVITGAQTADTDFPQSGLDGFMASILSTQNPEQNPGEPGQDVLQSILSLETPTLGTFTLADYINFRTFGMAVLRKDPSSGWEFQSGVTSDVTDAAKSEIKRQRMADYLNDNFAAIAAKYNKKLASSDRRDCLLAEYTRFLENLKSSNNPAGQRIEDFAVDIDGGNTQTLMDAGIFVDRIDVKMLQDMRTIVIQSTCGETVTIQVAS
uniref:Tail sheath protein n=1 Tax=viral metagenome TaxID=1070528 RepID=A0A6M3X7M6_9ZZZZ